VTTLAERFEVKGNKGVDGGGHGGRKQVVIPAKIECV